ncbi:MAG: efflux RND transporter periplasmic adaptor subunit [Verrucomicrobiales bacterium]
MNILRQAIIVTLITAVCAGGYHFLIKTKPEPPKLPQIKKVKDIEAMRLRKVDFPILVETFGTVEPQTKSTLSPEVAGRVTEISGSLREGGFFEAGDVLLKIESIDYEAGVTIAAGELAQAEATLREEEARAEQAAEDWKRLGRKEEPSDLVLRKPQLAEARARLASAEARLTQARKDLERTTLRAPYAGQVLEKNVDVGQYVSPSTVVARIFGVDYAEIKLPLKKEQLGFVEVPEHYRGDANVDAPDGPKVRLHTEFGGDEVSWDGTIVRAQSSIDTMSFQLFVVAQVKDPYARREDGKPPLKVGLFVNAEITGKTLKDVFVLPASALREGREVLIVGDGDVLESREVHIVWKEEGADAKDNVIIDEGLKDGEVVCLTPLGYGAVGAKVIPTIDGEAPPARPGEGGPGKKPAKP